MPNVSSSLGTTQRFIPGVNATQRGRFSGFVVIFDTLAALNLAVADERLNITDTSALWATGQALAVASEFNGGGCTRVWDATVQHARKVILRPGLTVTLASDANAVLFAAGAPSAGTGANGDVSVDWAGNAYYTKSGGTWASTGALYGVPTLPNMTTAATAGSGAEKTAFLQSLGLPGAAITVTTGRAIATTDGGQVLLVANGQAMTLDSGGLAASAESVSLLPQVGATYTLVVGTATLRTRTGGVALAGSTVISSNLSQTGEITVRRESDGSYVLESPELTGLGSQVTATGAFPARTNEVLQVIEVNSASAVTLTMNAGQFPRSVKPRGVLLVNRGAGVLTVTGLTTRPAVPPTCAQHQRMLITSDPTVDDQPWVAV